MITVKTRRELPEFYENENKGKGIIIILNSRNSHFSSDRRLSKVRSETPTLLHAKVVKIKKNPFFFKQIPLPNNIHAISICAISFYEEFLQSSPRILQGNGD